METDRREREGFVWPTVDLLAAVVGIGVVTYPVVATVLSMGDVPISPGVVTAVVAVGGAYPFVAGPWSLGTLGDYVLVWTGAVLALAVGAFPLAVAAGGIPPELRPVSQAVLVALAHLVAVVAVGVYGLAPTRRF